MTTHDQSPQSTPWLLVAGMFLLGTLVGGAALFLNRSREVSAEQSNQLAADTLAELRQAQSPNIVDASEELRALRQEIEQVRAAIAPREPRQSIPAVQPTPERQTASKNAQSSSGQTTLRYWNDLNSIIAREATLRAAPAQLNAGNASSFVSGRTAAFEYAVGAIEGLNSSGVDAQAVTLARELVAWYQQGAMNSRQAESLLSSNDIASRQGQAGLAWQGAEKRHRDQCLEINRRGETLRQDLSRKYGLAFPKLN